MTLDSGETFLNRYYSEHELNAILDTLKYPPLSTCLRVSNPHVSQKSAHELLISAVKKFCLSKGWEPLKIHTHPVRNDLFFVEMIYDASIKELESSRIDLDAKVVVVDEHCGRSVMRGADIFEVNRRVPRIMC
jgi:hypothetical protein